MKPFIDTAIGHSRTVIGALILILFAGAAAFVEIPKESEPDINIPIIYVSLVHDGISPEDAERLLIRPMEQALRGLEGVKELRSKGFEGGATITLEFHAGFDADAALDDVREKVDLAKPELPEETEEPTVHEVNFALFPVLVVTLAGEVPERALFAVARDLRDEIESLTSVLEVNIAGDREELVEVLIDPVKIESYGLSPIETVDAVRASNKLVAAGAQDTGKGRFAIKVPGLFENVHDIITMPVLAQGDSVITLGDIGEVRRTYKDPESFARVDGKPALALEVSKRTGENIIDTIAAVRRVVEAERADWPEILRQTIDIGYSQDKSDNIKDMLSELQNNVLAAVILVMVVVVAALGLRTAGLVGIAIPGSFLTGILVIGALGLTINMVVLFSLILAVGLLVDGAIVVTEYADRKMTEGEHRRHAYALAARRMAWPIIASTATTLAAFLPLVFWPGTVGEFMKFLPITLLATLSASLLMALVFVPTLGAFLGKPGGAADRHTMELMSEQGTLEPREAPGITGVYLRVLDKVLRHPAKVILGAVALLIAVQMTYAHFGKGVEFFPDVEPKLAKLQVKARGNLSIYEDDALLRQVEDRILGIAGFKSVYTRVGQEQRSDEAEDIIGTITLEFMPWDQRRTADQILAEVRRRTADLAGIQIDRREEEAGPPVGKDIQVELSSTRPELLPDAAARVRGHMESMQGMVNIEDSRPLPGIDVEVVVDRAQAAKFGASVDMVGRAIQLVSNGIKLAEYRPDDADDEIDIRVRYPAAYRTLDQLQHLRLETDRGPVPVANFVDVRPRPKTGTINRTDGKRVLTVKADAAEGVLPDTKVQELRAWLGGKADLDPRVHVEFKGQDEEQQQAEAFLVKAFGAALFIMALILVTQFNSFYSAFLILSAVVMSTIGVFIGLLVLGQPFGIVMSGIGVIALAGIVVNNNIVLIDTFDRLKASAPSVRDAVLKTGAQRLRPVLLTSVTTMLGLMPMVMRVNIDLVNRTVSVGAPSAQWWQQLSTAIVFGLAFATFLTLFVTPSALMLRGNVRGWLDRRRTRRDIALSDRPEGTPGMSPAGDGRGAAK